MGILDEAKDIINKNIQIFNENIRSICKIDCKMIHTNKPDFSIFHPANKEFFEYSSYVALLEWYIRDYIVTPIFLGLFELMGMELLVPDFNDNIAFKFSNEEFGNKYPFAFIVKQKTINFAVRYSSPYFENEKELKKQLQRHHLEHIEVIDWSDTTNLDSKLKAFEVHPKKVYFITLHKFFVKHFTEEIYYYYMQEVNKAVLDANNEIGFNTIQDLSLRNLSDFNISIFNNLSRLHLEEQYQKFDKENGEPSNIFFENLSKNDIDIINKRLHIDGLISSLIGKEKFAKCFLTSEYLYQIFEKGNQKYFDYTSVATGYFKSVELLLKRIMDLALDCSGHEKLWIKCGKNIPKEMIDDKTYRYNPNNKKVIQVIFIKNKECEFSTEMGPLIWFLHDRTDGWYISNEGKELVHECLLNYTKGCRNEHFHKDVIDDINSIKIIRSNTILCLFYLLGGCKLTDDSNDKRFLLEIEKNLYNSMYKKLINIPPYIKCFYLKFNDTETIKAIRLLEQQPTEYDERGNIKSIVKFIVVDNFEIGDYHTFLHNTKNENIINICPQNFPSKIWWYNKQKGRNEIFF